MIFVFYNISRSIFALPCCEELNKSSFSKILPPQIREVLWRWYNNPDSSKYWAATTVHSSFSITSLQQTLIVITISVCCKRSMNYPNTVTTDFDVIPDEVCYNKSSDFQLLKSKTINKSMPVIFQYSYKWNRLAITANKPSDWRVFQCFHAFATLWSTS